MTLQLQFMKIMKWFKTKRYISTMYNDKEIIENAISNDQFILSIKHSTHKAQKPEKVDRVFYPVYLFLVSVRCFYHI